MAASPYTAADFAQAVAAASQGAAGRRLTYLGGRAGVGPPNDPRRFRDNSTGSLVTTAQYQAALNVPQRAAVQDLVITGAGQSVAETGAQFGRDLANVVAKVASIFATGGAAGFADVGAGAGSAVGSSLGGPRGAAIGGLAGGVVGSAIAPSAEPGPDTPPPSDNGGFSTSDAFSLVSKAAGTLGSFLTGQPVAPQPTQIVPASAPASFNLNTALTGFQDALQIGDQVATAQISAPAPDLTGYTPAGYTPAGSPVGAAATSTPPAVIIAGLALAAFALMGH